MGQTHFLVSMTQNLRLDNSEVGQTYTYVERRSPFFNQLPGKPDLKMDQSHFESAVYFPHLCRSHGRAPCFFKITGNFKMQQRTSEE